MKKLIKMSIAVAGVAAIGYLAYRGLKYVMENCECCNCDVEPCDCGCDCVCHDEKCECECHAEEAEKVEEIVVEEKVAEEVAELVVDEKVAEEPAETPEAE